MLPEPFAIFQSLSDDLAHLLGETHRLGTADAADPLFLKAAVIGFDLSHPMQEWSRANFEFIESHLAHDLSPDTSSPSPECDEDGEFVKAAVSHLENLRRIDRTSPSALAVGEEVALVVEVDRMDRNDH